MKIIRPFAVTNASLTSNVPEGNPGTYNAGTTYALGNRVGVLTGTLVTVYESLQNSNTGKTPASSPLWWAEVADTYTAYNGGTSYADGDIVISATTHRKYESQVGSNVGNDPTTDDGTNWIDIGPTNRWAMFDQLNGTATVAEDEIAVSVVTTGRINSVALLEISGTSANITATYDAIEVYNETFDLADFSGITDWYEYFFAEVDYMTDLVVTDLPVYAGMTVDVTLTGSGPVSIGNCVIGLSRDLGVTVYGARVGTISYSRKVVDEFGGFTVVPRAYSKRGSFDIKITGESVQDAASRVDAVQKVLVEYRDTPVVYVGSGLFSSTVIFGFYKSFDIEIAFPMQHNLTLEVEGLT